MLINKELINDTRKWLGNDGILFFTKMVLEHGEISPVFNKGGFPHAVHFREGMQVRNHLREYLRENKYEDADSIELDDIWVEIVREAITEGVDGE